MAKYQVELEDGTVYEFEAAEGLTDEQAYQIVADQTKEPMEVDFDPSKYGSDWRAARKAIKELPEEQRDDARRAYADSIVAKERASGEQGGWNDLGRMFARNLPGGEWLDEGRAAVRSETPEGYQYQLDLEEARRRAGDAQRRPGVDLPWGMGRLDVGDVAKGAGFVAGMAVPFGAAAKGATLGRMMGTGALTGGLYSGVEASGAKRGSLAEKAQAAAPAVAVGSLVGAGGGALGHKLTNMATKPRIGGNEKPMGKVAQMLDRKINKVQQRNIVKPQTADDLREAAQKAYAKADNAGFSINMTDSNIGNRFFDRVMDDVYNKLKYDPRHEDQLSPGLGKILEDVLDISASADVPFASLERFRQVLSKYQREGKPATRAAARKITEAINDEIIGGLQASSLNAKMTREAGESAAAFAARRKAAVKVATQASEEARKLWGRSAKRGIIEEAMEKAQLKANSGATSVDKALRTAFGQILNNKNKASKFTKGERELMQAAMGAGGDKAKKLGALRQMATWDPANKFLSQAFIATSTAAGNPLPVVAGLSGHLASRKASNMTSDLAEDVLSAVSRGSTNKTNTANQKAIMGFAKNHPNVAKNVKRAGQTALRGSAVLSSSDSNPNAPMTEEEKQLIKMRREREHLNVDPAAIYGDLLKRGKK